MPWGEMSSLPPIPGDEPQNQPPLPQGQGLMDVMGQQQQFVEKNREENTKKPFEWSSKMLPDGQTVDTIQLPRELTNQIMQDLKWKASTMEAMQQEVNRVEKQRSSGNAIMDVLATVGGELAASDPRLPPVVSALGRASLRLNPTQQELTDRKVGLMQAMSQMGDQTLRSQEAYERTQIAAERGKETARHNLEVETDNKVKDALKRAAITAGKAGGPMDPDAFAAHMRAYGIKDQDRIDDAYQAHVSQAGVAVAGEKAKDQRKISSAKEIAEIKGDVQERVAKNLAPMRMANAERLQAERLSAMQGFREGNAADRMAFADYQKAQPGVMAVANMKDAIGTLRQLIKDNPDAVGVIEGRIPEAAITRGQAKVRAEFFTLLDATRQSINAGARFWNPQEFQALSPKLAAAAKTERANMGIMDALDDFSNRSARNIVRSHQYARWDQIGDEVWGAYKDDIFGKQEGSGKVNPERAPEVGPGKGKAPAAAAGPGPGTPGSVSPKVAEGLKGQPIGTVARRKDGTVIARVGKNGQIEPGP